METIAVYWEERVKVYGITDRPGLAMGVLRFPVDRMSTWSERIIDLERDLKRFELVTCRVIEADRMELSLVIEASAENILIRQMNGWLYQEQSAQFSMAGPVDMVFLHGPHFQDRFGIAETAFSALARKNIRIVLSSCAGTSMYLVFSEGAGMEAKKILTDTFLVPTVA